MRVDGSSRGGALFGWFNSADSYDWRTPDFIGLRLDRLGRGVVAYGEYGTRNTFTETSNPIRFSPGRAVTWTLQYLPAEGVEGAGLLRLIVGAAKVEVSLKAADGAAFDHFGLLNAQVEGPSLTATFANLAVDGTPVDLLNDRPGRGRTTGSRARRTASSMTATTSVTPPGTRWPETRVQSEA